jgi:hypothetical protein
MFGLSDNEDKEKSSGLEAVPADPVAADGSADPQAVVQPTSDPSTTAPPPFPVPADLPPPPTPAAPVPPMMEAVPTAPAAHAASAAPPTANDTMPELTSLSDIPEPPKPKKSSRHKKDQPTDDLITDHSSGPQEEELLKLKQEALHSLAPLVDQLEQTPEEKFKTTMMLIQASDNADLVQEAYSAASNISDPKIRAQALLDVVNEINYFTQAHETEHQE